MGLLFSKYFSKCSNLVQQNSQLTKKNFEISTKVVDFYFQSTIIHRIRDRDIQEIQNEQIFKSNERVSIIIRFNQRKRSSCSSLSSNCTH